MHGSRNGRYLRTRITWALAHVLARQKAITFTCMYRVKTHVDGTIVKHKDPSVVCCFQECESDDFSKSFAGPVAKYNSLWVLTTSVAHKNWPMLHRDVESTFFDADLKGLCTFGSLGPQGFEVDSQQEMPVCCLHKASRAWNTKIDSHLISQGLAESNTNYMFCLLHENGMVDITFVVCRQRVPHRLSHSQD